MNRNQFSSMGIYYTPDMVGGEGNFRLQFDEWDK